MRREECVRWAAISKVKGWERGEREGERAAGGSVGGHGQGMGGRGGADPSRACAAGRKAAISTYEHLLVQLYYSARHL